MKFSLFYRAAAALAVCISNSRASAQDSISAESLGVLLVGDQGKGNPEQLQVAQAMQSFCEKNRCDFGILLGDNFYESGVKKVSDQKFKTHFEIPYGKLGIEFWAILGNHDYGFGWSRGNVQAQIDYSAHSKFWRMPGRYYSFEKSGVEFVALDTVALKNDQQQLSWMQDKLQAEKKGFRVVLGHYPIHSGGLHGDTDFLRDQIAPKLCGAAEVYASGHDHHLEHLKSDCGMHLVVSGAGAEKRDVTPTPRTQFAASTLGFAYLKKESSAELTIRYYDSELNLLAEFKINRQ